MPNFYDISYTIGLVTAAPFWLIVPKARRKVLRALRERVGHDAVTASKRDLSRTAVLIHAVSLGEINATRALVNLLAKEREELQFIVTVTTDTGFARGQELYGSDDRIMLIRYPLDFTKAVGRVLDALKPSVVVLMELEVWPNFVLQCTRRNIPVLLVNGRLTESSFRSYRLVAPLVRSMFRRLTAACVQDETYAKRFAALGVPPDRLHVTGTMKFDNAQIADSIPGAEQLAADIGLDVAREMFWVCGSTGPGEEEIVLRTYTELLAEFPRLRLAIIPRHPERFDSVAELIRGSGFGLVRRSAGLSDVKSEVRPVVLGDTMGELRKFYSLANVVLVARTLVDLGPRQHGSDMIEPAALGKAVIVGPFTGNFADVMQRLRNGNGIREVKGEQDLKAAVIDLLRSPDDSAQMGRRAQEVVRASQGATARHLEFILKAIESNPVTPRS